LRDRAALGALLWPTGDADAQGYEEIEARAASAYEHWVGSEGLSFRGRDDAERLGDVVKFHWEAVAKDGEAFGVGLNFLVLAADGRIERLYVPRRLGGWAPLYSERRKGVSATTASTPAFAESRSLRSPSPALADCSRSSGAATRRFASSATGWHR
jgi:hypothetical protein